MGGASSTFGMNNTFIRFDWNISKVGIHFGDLGFDLTMLQFILEKRNVKLWNGLYWGIFVNVGGGGNFEYCNRYPNFFTTWVTRYSICIWSYKNVSPNLRFCLRQSAVCMNIPNNCAVEIDDKILILPHLCWIIMHSSRNVCLHIKPPEEAIHFIVDSI